MASKFFISVALLLMFCTSKAALGRVITCESLDVSTCAYAVSSAGVRCVLEKNAEEAYVCTASEIGAEGFDDWVETDECVAACGLDRSTVGISSDALLDAEVRQKLCSSECYNGCPNIVNLYFNLAAGEGVFLPNLCEGQQMNARRDMAEIRSSGAPVAPAPAYESAEPVAYPPAQFSDLFPPAESPM